MADEKYKKECNMLYYHCPLKIKIAQFPDGFRLHIVLLSNNCLFT